MQVLQEKEQMIVNEADLWGSLAHHLPDYVAILNTNGRFLFINRLPSNRQRDEIIGADAAVLIAPEAQEAFRASLALALKTEEPVELETRVNLDDGRTFWYNLRLCPITRADDKPPLLAFMIARDITEQKERKLDFEQRAELLDLATKYCPLGIFKTNKEGLIDYFNDACTELLGYTLSELRGQSYKLAIDRSQHMEADSLFERVQQGENIRGTFVCTHKEGHQIPICFNVSPIIENDTVIGITGVIRELYDNEEMVDRRAV